MGKALALGVGGILAALLNKLFAGRLKAWMSWFTNALLDSALERLPEGQRERFAEEWPSHLNDLSGDFGKVVFALGCVFAAREMASFSHGATQRTMDTVKPADRQTPSQVVQSLKDVQLLGDPISSKLSDKIRDDARQFPLFAELIPADFEAIISAAREKRFDRRETIFTEGDPVRQVTMVLSGFVKETKSLNGNELILRLSEAGEIVGSCHVRSNCFYWETAQAVQPCVALVWEAAVFERLLERFPVFRREVLEARLLEMQKRVRKGSWLSRELVRISDQLRRSPDNSHLENEVASVLNLTPRRKSARPTTGDQKLFAITLLVGLALFLLCEVIKTGGWR